MKINHTFKFILSFMISTGLLWGQSVQIEASESQGVCSILDESQSPTLDMNFWRQLTGSEQAQWIVRSVYDKETHQQILNKLQLEELIGPADQVNGMTNGLNRWEYQLEGPEGLTHLKLVYDETKDQFVEAGGELEYSQVPIHRVSESDFLLAGQVLKDNYALEQHSNLAMLKDQLGNPAGETYLFNMTVYRYLGEKGAKVAVTTIDDRITAINFSKEDKHKMALPIDKSPKELDRLSHEAGLNKDLIISILGQPDAINYDSKNGIITYGWFSQASDSVNEVYYYYAYNGISIGLAYK